MLESALCISMFISLWCAARGGTNSQKDINNFQPQDVSQHMINSSPNPKCRVILKYF